MQLHNAHVPKELVVSCRKNDCRHDLQVVIHVAVIVNDVEVLRLNVKVDSSA